jgi:oligopeptide/dipeptide ABC transporter ATP-binding protein
VSDRIGVMYLGKIVEVGPTADIYRQPLHPYTAALLSASPALDPRSRGSGKYRLVGDPPSLINPPSGCSLHPRCQFATEVCQRELAPLVELSPERSVACHRARELHLHVAAGA